MPKTASTDFELKHEDGFLVASFFGEISVVNSEEVRSVLFDLLHRNYRFIIIDLSGIDFLDSTALALLVTMKQRLALEGEHILAIAGTENSIVMEILKRTHLDQVFPTYPSYIEAIEKLEGRIWPKIIFTQS